MALVRATFREDPENMKFDRFAKLAGEAVYLKKLDHKLNTMAVQTAVAKLFER